MKGDQNHFGGSSPTSPFGGQKRSRTTMSTTQTATAKTTSHHNGILQQLPHSVIFNPTFFTVERLLKSDRSAVSKIVYFVGVFLCREFKAFCGGNKPAKSVWWPRNVLFTDVNNLKKGPRQKDLITIMESYRKWSL